MYAEWYMKMYLIHGRVWMRDNGEKAWRIHYVECIMRPANSVNLPEKDA